MKLDSLSDFIDKAGDTLHRSAELRRMLKVNGRKVVGVVGNGAWTGPSWNGDWTMPEVAVERGGMRSKGRTAARGVERRQLLNRKSAKLLLVLPKKLQGRGGRQC